MADSKKMTEDELIELVDREKEFTVVVSSFTVLATCYEDAIETALNNICDDDIEIDCDDEEWNEYLDSLDE